MKIGYTYNVKSKTVYEKKAKKSVFMKSNEEFLSNDLQKKERDNYDSFEQISNNKTMEKEESNNDPTYIHLLNDAIVYKNIELSKQELSDQTLAYNLFEKK